MGICTSRSDEPRPKPAKKKKKRGGKGQGSIDAGDLSFSMAESQESTVSSQKGKKGRTVKTAKSPLSPSTAPEANPLVSRPRKKSAAQKPPTNSPPNRHVASSEMDPSQPSADAARLPRHESSTKAQPSVPAPATTPATAPATAPPITAGTRAAPKQASPPPATDDEPLKIPDIVVGVTPPDPSLATATASPPADFIDVGSDSEEDGPRRCSMNSQNAKYAAQQGKGAIEKEIRRKKKAGKASSPYSMRGVAEHNTEDDLWIVVHGKIYQVESFVADHPGGQWALIKNGGKDCTRGFAASHLGNTSAYDQLKQFYVADVERASDASPSEIEDLIEAELQQIKVLSNEKVTPNVHRIQLDARDIDTVTPGGHVKLQIDSAEGDGAMRFYTPVHQSDGVMTFVIKAYADGTVSGAVTALPPGATVRCSQPQMPRFGYDPTAATEWVLVGGGTGIAPIYTIARDLLQLHDDGSVRVTVINACRTSSDALLNDELSKMERKSGGQMALHTVVSQPSQSTRFSGRLSRLHLDGMGLGSRGAATGVVCGPPGFGPAVADLLRAASACNTVHIME